MSKHPAANSRAERVFPWVVVGLFLWLSAWIVLSWPYMLDDALIHLRYADHLLHQGRITYDGVHDSFGTSSLLYVTLLAGLRALSASPLLPRVVSTVAYLAFFALLASQLRKLAQGGEESRASFLWLFAAALLAVVVAPSAVRWMDDGMETGLVFLDVLAGFSLLCRLAHSPRSSPGLLAGALLYGTLTVLLRVELLLLVGCISLMAFFEMFRGRFRRLGVEHPLRAFSTACLPLVGGLLGALLIRLTMHSLLPDTALAKAFGSAAWQDTFRMTAVTVASSFSFGVGLLLLWLGSTAVLFSQCRVRLADLPANLLFLVVLLTSAVRGQQIQGIRYFGWTLLFPILWNMSRIAEGGSFRPTHSFLRIAEASLIVLLVALFPAFAWESRTFHRLFQGRVATLEHFREEDLTGLQNRLGLAEDVGFIGYFTQGDICDPYGLVNGRAAAKLTYSQRFDRCMAQHPIFFFGSRELLQKVKSFEDLAGWSSCGAYPLDNVRTRDVHYLIVAPSIVHQACPTTAVPIETAVPHLL